VSSPYDLAPRLFLDIEEAQAFAGEKVRYLAWIDTGGEPIHVDPQVYSDRETLDTGSIDGDEGWFRVTAAGEHMVYAEVVYGGLLCSTTIPLEVLPGPPWTLDMQLSDLQADAGEPLDVAIYAWDPFGNELDTSPVQITTSHPDAKVVEGRLVSTVPELYTAYATWDALVDAEDFLVVSAAGASLELRLEDESLELDNTTVAHVTVVDAYGNEVDEDWDLWVEPPSGVDINYNAITFGLEGRYTVWAESEDGQLSDSVGPLLIDSTGPDPGISTPDRGHQTTAPQVDVRGQATEEYTGVASITVNGQPANISEDDSWSATADLDFASNFIHTVAIDGDGNQTSDLRTAISGDYTVYGANVRDGLIVRINEPGFDAIEEIAGDFLDADLLASAIPNPLIDVEEEDCFLGICVTWYALEVTIPTFSLGETELNIDPRYEGYLDTTAAVHDFYLELDADAVLLEIPIGIGGSVEADAITIAMDIWPYVSGATLGMSIGSVTVDMQGFDIDQGFYDVIEDVLNFFGIDLNGILADLIEGLIEDQIIDAVPELLADALQALEISVPLELEGNVYTFDALPSTADVDEYGLTLGMNSWFTAASWVAAGDSNPGSLTWPYSPPTYGAHEQVGMELGFSLDFLNQVFHAFWGGGLLELEIDLAEMGLDLSDLGDFLPDLGGLVIATRPLAPPVVVPGDGVDLLGFQMGDFELSIYSGRVHEDDLWMRVYVHIDAGLELAATEQGTLSAGLGEPDIRFDLVYPSDRSVYAGDTELLLETLVPMILPTLTDSLGEIPIPELEGFGLTDFQIESGGPENGYIEIGGNLGEIDLGDFEF